MGSILNSAEPYFMPKEQWSFRLEDEIHIWRFPTTGWDFSLLSNAERERASHFRFAEDKLRFSVGRQGLRLLVSKYIARDNGEIVFSNGPDGKLFLCDNTYGIRFNISHSGYWVLVALGKREVGIDIEKINNDFQFNDILEKCFTEKEQDYITSSEDPVNAFYILWTRKEAFIKASGYGLGENLKNIQVLNDHPKSEMGSEIWIVRSIPFSKGYAASIAYSGEAINIVYLDGCELIS